MTLFQVAIFVDDSIIEVYANGRFSLTSRVYPSLDNSLKASVEFRGMDRREEVEMSQVAFDCWDGLAKAWPSRQVADWGGVSIGVAEEEQRRTELEPQMLATQEIAA